MYIYIDKYRYGYIGRYHDLISWSYSRVIFYQKPSKLFRWLWSSQRFWSGRCVPVFVNFNYIFGKKKLLVVFIFIALPPNFLFFPSKKLARILCSLALGVVCTAEPKPEAAWKWCIFLSFVKVWTRCRIGLTILEGWERVQYFSNQRGGWYEKLVLSLSMGLGEKIWGFLAIWKHRKHNNIAADGTDSQIDSWYRLWTTKSSGT